MIKQKKKIRFESLGIETIVSNGIHYSWDGEIDNLHDHATQLRQRYAKKGFYKDNKDTYDDIEAERKQYGDKINGTLSRFYKFQLHPPPRSLGLYIHAYIRKGLSKETAIFVRGHEEAHALYCLGKAHLLGKEVDKICGTNGFTEEAFRMMNPIHDIALFELIANYGGRHALVLAQLAEKINIKPEEIIFVLNS